ncbi:hypothetical protein GUJ93_ZPchr0006g45362 [Zizania palustris]|uniref:Uncharacterized protein n=1 Tax=Zizania palustris TaxID=103762 RepID=A0A8J5T1P0_ZIZPA|nr:hypothetical protein GUJ93_ZPchr0006g45362 [Zizania palustris]
MLKLTFNSRATSFLPSSHPLLQLHIDQPHHTSTQPRELVELCRNATSSRLRSPRHLPPCLFGSWEQYASAFRARFSLMVNGSFISVPRLHFD